MTDSPPDLARRVSLGDFSSPEVLAWLAESFRRHLFDGLPIETALRLDRASRMRARNEALRRAAALLVRGTTGPHQVSLRLAQAVAYHGRRQGEPSTPIEAAIAAAFGAGVGVPTTARQLFDIVL